MYDRVLIANRGEIAARVARTCKRLGIYTIAVYSEADEGAPHTQIADEAHEIGPAPVLESYLDGSKIIEVAEETDAEAIHPGYGLLSENSEFVEEVETSSVDFVGPRSEVMNLMGHKADARAFARDAGVPVVPGSDGPVEDIDAAVAFAEEAGYPVLVKAAAGGGGIGMRKAEDEESLQKAFKACRRRGESAFGDPTVYMEKYIENPRHIEIQILADTHGKTLHMFERECSVQRRHQKVIEETPSTIMDKFGGLRQEMADAAVDLARAAEYTNAGTVEFVVDDQEGEFYFIEMNTRLQVEHTVTEMITDIDIVEHQLRIADGEPLEFLQEDIKMNGHSVECRIYAEDPDRNFMPAPGKITDYQEPSGEGIRVDSGARANFEITRYYDPLVSKVITHGELRDDAIDRMEGALENYTIGGLTTNKQMHLEVLGSEDFRNGTVHTSWLENR